MCTLTHIPTPSGYILTHNRDERSNRPTSPDIQTKAIDGRKIYFPQDLEAFGSWIAYSESGRAACLLNGGDESYQRKPKYRKSRGLVVLESFGFDDIKDFKNQYDFDDIEPFTLLIRDKKNLYQVIHDETQTHLQELDFSVPHIWSSTTLYSQEVRRKREVWFENWLHTKPKIEEKNIQNFHLSAGDGDSENDLVMSRWGILQTLSLTQISLKSNQTSMTYKDLIHNHLDQLTLSKSK